MKLRILIGITFIIPLTGLFYANYFAVNLSAFQVNTVNFVCLTVLFIALTDVLFLALKRYKQARD